MLRRGLSALLIEHNTGLDQKQPRGVDLTSFAEPSANDRYLRAP